MMEFNLQLFGGRGSSADIDKLRKRMSSEGGSQRGTVKPLDASEFKDYSLEQVESRIRGLAHEELFILDENDKVIAAYKGNATSVAFPASYLAEKGLTVTHGHPKGAEEFGGTFSFADVKNMIASNWKEHRATASGQGEMNYIMRRTSKATPKNTSRLGRKLRNEEGKVMNNMADAYNKTYKSAIASGKSKSQAMHMARQTAVGVIDKYWSDTLPKYGFTYTKRKKNYKYGR